MIINALIVNPDKKGQIIRERLQKLSVQCDALFSEQDDVNKLLDYEDKIYYRYTYSSLNEVLTNPYQLNYQLVLAGSPLCQEYCDIIVKQLGLNGVAIMDNETKSNHHYRHIVSFR